MKDVLLIAFITVEADGKTAVHTVCDAAQRNPHYVMFFEEPSNDDTVRRT